MISAAYIFQVVSNTNTPFADQTHFSDTVRNVSYSIVLHDCLCVSNQVLIRVFFGRLLSRQMES